MKNKIQLSKSLGKLASKTSLKTETVLSLFLLTVIVVMSSAMLFIVNISLKNDLNAIFLNTNENKAKATIRDIQRYILRTKQLLTQQSKQGILTQALMQPESYKGRIRDYFESGENIGGMFEQKLYDFKGDLYFPSTTNSVAHLPVRNMFKPYQSIYENTVTSIIEFDDLNKALIIALPITYQDSVEGIFTSHLPIAAITEQLDLDELFDIEVEVQIGEKSISWGNAVNPTKGSSVLSNDGLIYSYTLGTESLNQAMKRSQVRLVIIAIAIAALALFFATHFGRRFFVKPLESLKHFAAKISLGADPRLESTKRKTREVQLLSDTIESMAKKIYVREKELREANEHLKQHQDSLVQQEKMASLGQIMAGVAHEINNPIGFIMNNLTMMQEYHEFLLELTEQLLLLKGRVEKNEDTRELLLEIEKTLQKENLQFVLDDLNCITSESIEGTQRVKEIVRGLKGYSHNSETPSMVDIGESIESTLRVVWNEIKYNCQVSKHFEHKSRILCIGGQINQVLMNIIINAAQAMEEKSGQLVISTEEMCDCVVVKISDNGPGIKPEHLDKIFDPFFTTKPVGQGTGLGMSICYDIIKNHGGKIEIDSEIDAGTTFTIVLPIQPLIRLNEGGTESAYQ